MLEWKLLSAAQDKRHKHLFTRRINLMLSPEFSGAHHQVWNSLVPLRRVAVILGILSLTGCGGDSVPTSAVSLSATHNLSLTITQKTSLTVTTSDAAGVRWSITPAEGSFSPAISHSGETVTFTAPSTAGIYTVTATNVTDGSTSSTATAAVTDLAGVYTYHNNLSRTGTNDSEYALSPSNVNSSSFGKLFSCVVDGPIYGQPLWVANFPVYGAVHNVVFATTGHDSIFAFDADANPCMQLWAVSLIDSAHGASAGESPVPSAGPSSLVGLGGANLTPETGITGTPVIDPASGTLYVVSKSIDSTGDIIYQRLHAIDLATGSEKRGSPITITATSPGSGDGGSTVTFNPKTELQRAGLALVNGTVVITWASHEDAPPYYGWVMGYTYDGLSFKQTQVLNTAPNAGYGGIWMSGSAPAADDAGNLYLLTGNGTFDVTGATVPGSDYGDSLLQLSSNLAVTQYFTPTDQGNDAYADLDFGSGGVLLVDLPAGSPVAHLITGGGKDGNLYVLNRESLGGYGDQFAEQELAIGGALFTAPTFWNNRLFINSIAAALQAYQLDPSTAQFSPASASTLLTGSYGIGSPSSISASGTTNGIVWSLNNSANCSVGSTLRTPKPGGPAILEAHDADNLANLLWSSASSSADAAGGAVSFSVPTVANGKVYVGTRGTGGAACSLTSTTGELDVYGLKN